MTKEIRVTFIYPRDGLEEVDEVMRTFLPAGRALSFEFLDADGGGESSITFRGGVGAEVSHAVETPAKLAARARAMARCEHASAQAVLALFKPGERINNSEVIGRAIRAEMNPASVGPLLSALSVGGRLERQGLRGHHTYSLAVAP